MEASLRENVPPPGVNHTIWRLYGRLSSVGSGDTVHVRTESFTYNELKSQIYVFSTRLIISSTVEEAK